MSVTLDVAPLHDRVVEIARAAAVRLGESFVEEVRSTAPRRTGVLSDSVEASDVEESSTEMTVHVTVGADYARWNNDGTGIFGPDGVPIRPTSSRVLVFDWPAAGGIVFARSVRGAPGSHFWERAMDQWPRVIARAA